jgi:uncharacterized protein
MRWIRHHIQIKETVLTVLCEERFLRTAENAARAARQAIESTIERCVDFAISFTPVPVSDSEPEIVRKMALAAQRMNVGPMAAVAGAVAEFTLTALLDDGAREAVVDNGGDIALKIDEPLHIGIYAGASPVKDLAFHVEPGSGLLSICTSSGTVGHSFSYGKADAAVVISADACLADAAATALGNRIKGPADVEHAFDFLYEQIGIQGALAICQDKIGLFGELPKLVRTSVDVELITQGKGYGKN